MLSTTTCIPPALFPWYLECHHEEKGGCKAETRCPQFLPPRPDHAALLGPQGTHGQIELGIRQASLLKVFSPCHSAVPLHPYSSSWSLLPKKTG